MLHQTRIAVPLISAAFAIGLLAATPAYAASGSQQTTHESFDATGVAYSCGANDLTVTVTGGTADQVMHTGLDSTGVFHYTGTLTVNNLTAQDTQGRQYTITGSSWFGGKGTESQQQIESDTEHFVIRNADGSVYSKVQIVDHFTVNGNSFTFDIGGCEPPPE